MDKELRIVISGGGTGGHIFPAVSIANAIKAKHPEAKILFVGALGRMEMQRVPAAGRSADAAGSRAHPGADRGPLPPRPDRAGDVPGDPRCRDDAGRVQNAGAVTTAGGSE